MKKQKIKFVSLYLTYDKENDDFLVSLTVIINKKRMSIGGRIIPEELPDSVEIVAPDGELAHGTTRRTMGFHKDLTPNFHRLVKDWIDSIGDLLDKGYYDEQHPSHLMFRSDVPYSDKELEIMLVNN